MDLWFSTVLGVVQGFTEFLPISSTAHLRIAPELMGQSDPGAAFSAVIQLGTLAAVLVYFARELFVDMPRAILYNRKSSMARMPIFIIVGSIPIVIAGLGLKDFITGDARSLFVVASALAIVAVIMLIAERMSTRSRGLHEMRLSDALIIGCAQTLALIPGVSRSGSTIVAALFLGLKRPEAARFSFLLGIPAIGGAGLFELKDAAATLGDSAWGPIAAGTIAAFVCGYASIAWLLKFLGKNSLRGFAYYRIALGVAVLALVLSGVVEA